MKTVHATLHMNTREVINRILEEFGFKNDACKKTITANSYIRGIKVNILQRSNDECGEIVHGSTQRNIDLSLHSSVLKRNSNCRKGMKIDCCNIENRGTHIVGR